MPQAGIWYAASRRCNYDDSTSPASILAGGDPSKTGLKGLSTTLGPLKRRLLETGPVVTSNVPLLGDAAPGDIDEAILAAIYRVWRRRQIHLPTARPNPASFSRPVNC